MICRLFFLRCVLLQLQCLYLMYYERCDRFGACGMRRPCISAGRSYGLCRFTNCTPPRTPPSGGAFVARSTRSGGVNFYFMSDLPWLGKIQVNLLLPSLIRIFDFVEDTSPQQNCKQVCFCFRLIRTLASPKILPLGKIQVNLLLPSLIRIFDFVEDTSPQQNCKQVCFCFRLIRIFAL